MLTGLDTSKCGFSFPSHYSANYIINVLTECLIHLNAILNQHYFWLRNSIFTKEIRIHWSYHICGIACWRFSYGWVLPSRGVAHTLNQWPINSFPHRQNAWSKKQRVGVGVGVGLLTVTLPITLEKNFTSSAATWALLVEVRGEMVPSEDTTVVPLNRELNWWCGSLGLLMSLEKTDKKRLYHVGWDDWSLMSRARAPPLQWWGKEDLFLGLKESLDTSWYCFQCHSLKQAEPLKA